MAKNNGRNGNLIRKSLLTGAVSRLARLSFKNSNETQTAFRFLHGSVPRFLWSAQMRFDYLVLQAGIEPAFLPSQGSVLSIERQGQTISISRSSTISGRTIWHFSPQSESFLLPGSIERQERLGSVKRKAENVKKQSHFLGFLLRIYTLVI